MKCVNGKGEVIFSIEAEGVITRLGPDSGPLDRAAHPIQSVVESSEEIITAVKDPNRGQDKKTQHWTRAHPV
jgi:hypothetical protein